VLLFTSTVENRTREADIKAHIRAEADLPEIFTRR